MTDDEPAHSYRNLTDRVVVGLGLHRFAVPCRHAKWTDECFKMHAQQRWRGVWRVGPLNDQAFCPKGKGHCFGTVRPTFVLEMTDRTTGTQLRIKPGKSYEVDLLGRRTAYPTGSTGPDYTIVVDRFISVKELSADDKAALADSQVKSRSPSLPARHLKFEQNEAVAMLQRRR